MARRMNAIYRDACQIPEGEVCFFIQEQLHEHPQCCISHNATEAGCKSRPLGLVHLPRYSPSMEQKNCAHFDMSDLDPMDPVHVPYLDPWLSRMEVALGIATRAVISSSSFFLKVLCAKVITLDSKRKAYDPNYIPTDADRSEYRLMMDHLSTNHRLYVNDHGKFCPDTYGESQMTSNAKGYVWGTILNVWFVRHYNRPGFENFPESERRIVDFAVAVTLAHEFAHVVNNYHDWKELLAQDPYTYCSAKFINHMGNFNLWSEPCFSVRQWQP
jgi:hypothetical protein